MWKDFFYYSKSERRVAIFLLSLAVILLVGALYIGQRNIAPQPVCLYESEQIDSFMTDMRKKKKQPSHKALYKASYESSEDRAKAMNRKHGKETKNDSRETYKLTVFDPNTADSSALSALGLPAFAVNNILKFRDAGGLFHTAEDVQKIYGMNESKYRQLLPYISISPQFAPRKKPVFPHTEKYPSGTTICINTADTTQLKKIPGIGTVLAANIVRYRNRLGGFYSISQLQEIPNIDSTFCQWFIISNDTIRKIKVNNTTLEQMCRHPYMDFYKAKALIEYRRRYGRIEHIGTLQMMEAFHEADIRKLQHYLSFE